MKNSSLTALVMLILACPAFAQEIYPAVEFGVGYTLLHDDRIDPNPNGFVASASGNVNRWFAVESEFGGAFDFDVWSYVGGPRFTMRTQRASHYLHVLFGGEHQSASISRNSGFGAFEGAAQAGGGVSVRMTPKLALNFGGDYRQIYGDFQMNRSEIRFNIGVVFGVGTRF